MSHHDPLPLSPDALRQKRRPIRNINQEHRESISLMERLALSITTRVGTMGFFLIIFTWTVSWLGWNILAPKRLQFDPPMAFVFWLFISNMIQILLMPLIMVGQNLQGRHAELRAENDYEINVKAERETQAVLMLLERQNAMLTAIMAKMNIRPEAEDQKTPEAPENS